MDATHTPLDQWPLWRLIVALDDAERTVGPTSQTARLYARLLRERLAGQTETRRPTAAPRQGVTRAD
jgi:hypothetical protein